MRVNKNRQDRTLPRMTYNVILHITYVCNILYNTHSCVHYKYGVILCIKYCTNYECVRSVSSSSSLLSLLCFANIRVASRDSGCSVEKVSFVWITSRKRFFIYLFICYSNAENHERSISSLGFARKRIRYKDRIF